MPEPADADLLAEADALYALTPGEFTAARDARSRELRADDAALATAVKKLRRPGIAAWVVNLLVRREQEQVAEVLAVGEALREAQQTMEGEELRALTRQRRQLTAAVTGRARRHASDAGQPVTRAVADQVEATLTAAMLDEGCAAAVRSGLLVGPLATTGVDDVDAGAAVALPAALGFAATAREGAPEEPAATDGPTLRVVPDPDADEKARAAARERLEEAEEALDGARSEAAQADEHVSSLQARSMQLAAEVDELRRRIAELDEDAEEVDAELAAAEEAAEEARETAARAERERDEAREAAARLD